MSIILFNPHELYVMTLYNLYLTITTEKNLRLRMIKLPNKVTQSGGKKGGIQIQFVDTNA